MCSNAFSTKGSLKVHMRLHTGAKPFKCPHCELRFRTSGRRKTHMQFHYKPDPKKARKPAAPACSEGLQPVSLLGTASSDPSVFIMNNSVLTGQLDQSLLQQGLVGQAVLPASVSGEPREAPRTLLPVLRPRDWEPCPSQQGMSLPRSEPSFGYWPLHLSHLVSS